MSYNRRTAGSGPTTFGFGGAPIDLSAVDYTVPNTVKGIVVVNTGNVICVPVSGSSITVTAAPVGFILPWHCVTITRTGTTATLATIAES